MGRRGPPRTPLAILRMRDSRLVPGREKEGEVQFEAGVPVRPAFLTGEARKEWRRQVKQLTAAGVLQLVDGPLLAVWCQTWAEFVEVSRQLAQTGPLISYPSGAVGINPLASIRNQAAARLLQLAGQFGFTPAARTRIKSVAPPPAADPFDEFLGKSEHVNSEG